jgi:hypothetical protein
MLILITSTKNLMFKIRQRFKILFKKKLKLQYLRLKFNCLICNGVTHYIEL